VKIIGNYKNGSDILQKHRAIWTSARVKPSIEVQSIDGDAKMIVRGEISWVVD
jgi:hypothetical protein